MLHIIEGRSGSGKTDYVYSVLADLAKSGSKKLVYLIPEQSSFECEKDFLHLLGPLLSKNIRVMSFTRLYNMVMSETGGVSGTPIDDAIRKIIMSYTLEDCKDNLGIYARQATKPQFTELTLSAVKELKQCGISPEMLREKSTSADSAELKNKLNELSFVYDLYNANVEKSGIDPYDNDMRLYNRIAETKFFKDYTVAVDDFSGFTAQQHKILELMMSQADDFYITLCKDADTEEEVFFTVNRTKKRIVESAKKEGIKVASPVKLRENVRTKSDALMYVEENIYRHDNPEFDFEGVPSEDVSVVRANDVYDECEYIAGKIADLAVSGECRYRDIAVVFIQSENYDGIIDRIFEKYGIPYFMSKPQPIEAKPLIRLAVSALEYAMTPNDEQKLISAAKSGLLGISPLALARLENYAFVWGLKGRQFFDDFKLPPRGYSDTISESDIANLLKLNKTRISLTSPFAKLINALTSDDGYFTAKEISTAVYNFLQDCGVPVILKKRAKEKLEFSDEELRLWDILMDILGKMHSALGDRRITVRRYLELFKSVIKDADISDIPQTLDEVLVGKADSIRLSKPYAVFIVGAVDGVFPHIPVPSGVFNDAERRRLINAGLPLYDSVTELFLQEKYFVYNAVSAPTNKLCVSYPKGGLSGGDVDPSTIIGEITRIFQSVSVESTAATAPIDRLATDKTAFEQLARNYTKRTPFTSALTEYIGETEAFKNRLPSLGSDVKNLKAHLSDRQAAAAVFGVEKHLSASQIEKFYECHFQYFCNYGLRLKELRKADLDPLVYGNLLHYIMENAVVAYKENNYEQFSDDELSVIIETLLDKYIKSELGGEEDKSERFKQLYYRSKKRVLKVLGHMMTELDKAQFKPVDAELEIGDEKKGIKEYTVTTENGNSVHINGKVDRVDMLKGEESNSVRIIDYKTNEKKFNVNAVPYGQNMQMLIYLSAIEQNGDARYNSALSPAGVFYMQSDSGSVTVKDAQGKSEETLEKEAEKEKNKKLMLNGIFVDDEAVEQGMESDNITNFKKSKISKNRFDAIFECVYDKIRQMSDSLDNGDIEAKPTESASTKILPCEWCNYADVCRREKDDESTVFDKAYSEKVLNDIEKELSEK